MPVEAPNRLNFTKSKTKHAMKQVGRQIYLQKKIRSKKKSKRKCVEERPILLHIAVCHLASLEVQA
jgi:hypothetical protein